MEKKNVQKKKINKKIILYFFFSFYFFFIYRDFFFLYDFKTVSKRFQNGFIQRLHSKNMSNKKHCKKSALDSVSEKSKSVKETKLDHIFPRAFWTSDFLQSIPEQFWGEFIEPCIEFPNGVEVDCFGLLNEALPKKKYEPFFARPIIEEKFKIEILSADDESKKKKAKAEYCEDDDEEEDENEEEEEEDEDDDDEDDNDDEEHNHRHSESEKDIEFILNDDHIENDTTDDDDDDNSENEGDYKDEDIEYGIEEEVEEEEEEEEEYHDLQ